MRTLADVIEEFANSEQGKNFERKMKAERDKSPAKFERKFDREAMMLAMEINGRCKIINYYSHIIDQDRVAWESGDTEQLMSHDQMSEVWDNRADEIHAASEALRKYAARIKILDQAVLDEDSK